MGSPVEVNKDELLEEDNNRLFGFGEFLGGLGELSNGFNPPGLVTPTDGPVYIMQPSCWTPVRLDGRKIPALSASSVPIKQAESEAADNVAVAALLAELIAALKQPIPAGKNDKSKIVVEPKLENFEVHKAVDAGAASTLADIIDGVDYS